MFEMIWFVPFILKDNCQSDLNTAQTDTDSDGVGDACGKFEKQYSIVNRLTLNILKVPGPIASDFCQTFGDFGIRRKLIIFLLPLVNFTADKCTVWKILM